MDLRAEWDAPGVREIFDDPDNHLHPYAPDFTRRIDLYWRGDVHRRARGARCRSRSEPSSSPKGVRSVLSVPVFVRDGVVGVRRVRRLHRRSHLERRGDRRPAGGRRARWACSSTASWQSARRRWRMTVTARWSSTVPRSATSTPPTSTRRRSTSARRSKQLLGYSPQEWVEDPEMWPNLLHPDDRDASDRRERAAQRDRRAVPHGVPACSTATGTSVWVHDEATIVRDERGVPRFSHGVMMDISDRKRGEENVAFLAYHDELTGLAQPLDVRRAARAVDLPGAPPRRRRRGDRGRHRRLPARERLARALERRRDPADGGRPPPRGLARDRPRGAPGRRPVPDADRRPRVGGDQRDGDRRGPGRGRRATGAGGDARAVRRRRRRALRLGEHGDQLVPEGRRRRERAPAQRRGRDVRVEEVGSGGLRGLIRRRVRFQREAAVRDPAPQGGRQSAVDAALPAGHRARDRSHGRRRGADPLDRARRHDGAAERVHPPRRGARPDRADRRLGGAGARVPGAGLARARHRPRDRVQPLAAAVLAARPRRAHPRSHRRRRRRSGARAGRDHGDLGDDGSRSRAGDPLGPAPRRPADRDRRLRHRVLVAVAAA